MKHRTFTFITFIFIILFSFGCGFHGRKYTTGHYWDGRNEIEFDAQNEKQNEKQKENGNEELKNTPLGKVVHEVQYTIVYKDTLNQKLAKKPLIVETTKKKEETKTKEEEVPDVSEKKIRRSTRGFISFWSIESLFYLGFLGNAYAPDVWGFWLAIFGVLTALYMLPTMIYLLVMKRRFKLGKEQIKDDKLKQRIPKLTRLFALVMITEAILLILAFVLGGNL